MENHTTIIHSHRRTRPNPEPDSSPSSTTMDPNLNNPSQKTNPDSKKSLYYKTSHHLSRLSLYNNSTTQKKHFTPGVDIRLQAKAMNRSADADSSNLFLVKSSKGQEETQKKKIKESACKDIVKKSSKGGSFKKKEGHGDGKKMIFVKDKDVKDSSGHERHEAKRVSVSLNRRRSFCGAQVELADVLANCGVKVVSVDMPPFMQIHAVDCARKTFDSLEKFTAKALALTLKKEFDGVYGPAWHCIVGTSFGSFVTHSVGGFLYFSMDQKTYVLLFKTTVQKAD